MSKLSIRIQGNLDDATMNISLQTSSITFKATIYVSDRELADQSAMLSALSDNYYQGINENERAVSFGPRLEDSPGCDIYLPKSITGNILVRVDLRTIVSGSSHSAVDRCTAHFVTDVASLDAFCNQLASIANKSTSAAELRGFF